MLMLFFFCDMVSDSDTLPGGNYRYKEAVCSISGNSECGKGVIRVSCYYGLGFVDFFSCPDPSGWAVWRKRWQNFTGLLEKQKNWVQGSFNIGLFLFLLSR